MYYYKTMIKQQINVNFYTICIHYVLSKKYIKLQYLCSGENAFVGILLLHVLSLEVLRESVYPYHYKLSFGGYYIHSTIYVLCLQASMCVHLEIFHLYVLVFSLIYSLLKWEISSPSDKMF